ncbi:hypothetical protein HN371_30260 [Candidatus Poribacteria bacterium]|jgi:two-component system, chemotaxis family, sensor kinase CheA|nr:hypothetical protein [Candidatus Poribacteria bacterium]MBT7804942.1 hypothetical protein [Candidatus Poribacteria bacterium]
MAGGVNSDDTLRDFLEESNELLDQADQDLVALESAPEDAGTLASIFRTLHTVKGSCAFLGFARLEELAHSGENLLGKLRDGQLTLTVEMTDALLAVLDSSRTALASIESTGGEPDDEYAELIARLRGLHEAPAAPVAPAEEPVAPEPAAAPAVDTDAGERAEADDFVREFLHDAYQHLDHMDHAFAAMERDAGRPEALREALGAVHGLHEACVFMGLVALGELTEALEHALDVVIRAAAPVDQTTSALLVDAAAIVAEALAEIQATGEEGLIDDRDVLVALRAVGAEASAPSEPSASAGDSPPPPAAGEAESAPKPVATTPRPTAASDKIRVGVAVLDTLMNQVGELVLSRNQILQYSGGLVDAGLTAMVQQLNQITTELQESVMKTRLQPIGTIWNKFPRVARDLAHELGKQVRLEMQGAETELDKNLIEAITDPLTHLVRNSIDHGVEMPDVREEAGKPAEGVVLLHAYHEGGQVNIEISDDGRGIDVRRIVEKAVQNNLVTSTHARDMSDREAFELLFHPGFSTAAEVTHVSGRGVGMDVVRSNIDRINGIVDIQSELGLGTKVKIKIPLTLAIVPALSVTCAGARYAIPQASLVAVVRLGAGEDDSGRGIEELHHAPVYRWRGRLLPLIFLRDELGIGPPGDGEDDDLPTTIVVLQVEGRLFGLLVDRVLDSGEIVVKPLGKGLSKIPVYAGATIMGDGTAALILDVFGLLQNADLAAHDEMSVAAQAEDEPTTAADAQTVLLVRHGGERFALPLTEIPRLEKIPRSAVEREADRPVVQYRGTVLPIKDILDGAGGEPWWLNGGSAGDDDSLNVIVYASRDRPVGLVVDEIEDVVEEQLTLVSDTSRWPEAVGTAVVLQEVAAVLDIDLVTRL